MKRILLALGAFPLAALPLLWLPWFEAGETFAMLHGEKAGVVLEPSAWESSGSSSAMLALLALAGAGAAAAAAAGKFVAWTVGAACAGAGGLLALTLRISPPAPPRETYVTAAQAYDPTWVPIASMIAFALALIGLTVWAMRVRRTLDR